MKTGPEQNPDLPHKLDNSPADSPISSEAPVSSSPMRVVLAADLSAKGETKASEPSPSPASERDKAPAVASGIRSTSASSPQLETVKRSTQQTLIGISPPPAALEQHKRAAAGPSDPEPGHKKLALGGKSVGPTSSASDSRPPPAIASDATQPESVRRRDVRVPRPRDVSSTEPAASADAVTPKAPPASDATTPTAPPVVETAKDVAVPSDATAAGTSLTTEAAVPSGKGPASEPPTSDTARIEAQDSTKPAPIPMVASDEVKTPQSHEPSGETEPALGVPDTAKSTQDPSASAPSNSDNTHASTSSASQAAAPTAPTVVPSETTASPYKLSPRTNSFDDDDALAAPQFRRVYQMGLPTLVIGIASIIVATASVALLIEHALKHSHPSTAPLSAPSVVATTLGAQEPQAALLEAPSEKPTELEPKVTVSPTSKPTAVDIPSEKSPSSVSKTSTRDLSNPAASSRQVPNKGPKRNLPRDYIPRGL